LPFSLSHGRASAAIACVFLFCFPYMGAKQEHFNQNLPTQLFLNKIKK